MRSTGISMAKHGTWNVLPNGRLSTNQPKILFLYDHLHLGKKKIVNKVGQVGKFDVALSQLHNCKRIG